MENIHALIKQCGLGTIEGEILRVSGGYMHKMFKVHTSAGIYAVKSLNPEIMCRPDALVNFSEAERLERILEDAGLPVVAALSFDGKKMMSVNGSYYYVFPWLEGKITDFNSIDPDQSYTAGSLLGRIHGIESETFVSEEHEICNINFENLLDEARSEESIIVPLLESNISLLENACAKLNEARNNLPKIRVISDDDMDPKNIMWHNGNAYIIDLECLGYSNPVSSCLELSLQWAGIVTEHFNKENLESFFKGYLDNYDNGFRKYHELIGVAYTWVEWLEYNIRRALGMVSSDPEEIKLGESETINTINRIKYLNSIEVEICSVLEKVQGR